jgi:hypothetical protein
MMMFEKTGRTATRIDDVELLPTIWLSQNVGLLRSCAASLSSCSSGSTGQAGQACQVLVVLVDVQASSHHRNSRTAIFPADGNNAIATHSGLILYMYSIRHILDCDRYQTITDSTAFRRSSSSLI